MRKKPVWSPGRLVDRCALTNDTAQIATGRLATGAGSSGNRQMRSVPKGFGRARASLLAECSELTTGQIGRRWNCRSDAVLEPAILSSPDL